MLQRRGYAIQHAASAEDALREVKRQQFDVVLSDIGLPDLDGWQLLEQLRAAQPTIRGIAVSGYAHDVDYRKSMEAGFYLHLKKPVPMDELEAAIGSLFPDRMDAAHR
jgi:CheY-like chemotaxis protein